MASTSQQPNKSLFGKFSEKCSSHGGLCLAIIILLVIIIIVMTVYYRGIFGIGPYGKYKNRKHSGKHKESDGSTQNVDKETADLIESLNS